jgi:hypothetical protein
VKSEEFSVLIIEVVKRSSEWCRVFLSQENRNSTNGSSTLIALATKDYDQAYVLSKIFESAAIVLNSLEHIIRAIQCRFSLNADHSGILQLLKIAKKLSSCSSVNSSTISVLCSTLFNISAIMFNSGNRDEATIEVLNQFFLCLLNRLKVPKTIV